MIRFTITGIVFLLNLANLHSQSIHPKKNYPPFSLGTTGIILRIDPGFLVKVHDPGKHSDLSKNATILSINQKKLTAPDPRRALGQAITEAEKNSGVLELKIQVGAESIARSIKISVLGSYSHATPAKCKKSQKIIQSAADYISSIQQSDGSYLFDQQRVRNGLRGSLAGLFLLSTDNPKYLPQIKRHVSALSDSIQKNPTTNNWHLGYQGILLAEYYIKTGDSSVLTALKSLCDQAVKYQTAGGWGHRGIPNPGYVQSGLMNSAGIPVLTTLILARECGVRINEDAYRKAIQFMSRMVGHGCVPYGDHRSELWWSNTNGRNGMLACAFSLIEHPTYQKASEHLAMLVTDSYHQPEFGHTGGGFNFIWRGLSSVHVPDEQKNHRARQMNQLTWYYDLARQPDGSFSMLPTPPDNTRYTGKAWATGALGLTYTAPLKTLRITGAAKTRHSKKLPPPPQFWGNSNDAVFLSTEHAHGYGEETHAPHEIYRLLLGVDNKKASLDFCIKQLHHYSPMVRAWAGKRIRSIPAEKALPLLSKAARHSDPRVRRAALDCISGYDNWGRPPKSMLTRSQTSEHFLPIIKHTLAQKNTAWWEKDAALFALGKCRSEDIRDSMPLIKIYLQHQDWYLRESAFWTIAELGSDITGEEFQLLADAYRKSIHVFARSSYDGAFRKILRSNPAALTRINKHNAVKTISKVTHDAPDTLGYGSNNRHEAAHRTMMILAHFDPSVFKIMTADFVKYLESWDPYHQHSVWLMAGSKWQPGILSILNTMGEEGKPIASALESILEKYPTFDKKRIGKNAQQLEASIQESLELWQKKSRP